MHTLASSKVIYFPQERNIQLGYLFKKAPQRQRTQIFATHQDQNASFLPKLYTTIQLKQRLENIHYYPMSPSYLASQPGGKGWFCHGWNCVQAFAIFDFTSDKNKNNASVASCHSTSNIPCNASELLSENCSHLGTLDKYPFIFFSPIEAIVYLLWRT